MAIQAKRHCSTAWHGTLRHVIDLAMAFDATDAAIDMHGMVEINVIGQLVNLHPRDGFAGGEALAHQSQSVIVLQDWLWQFMQTEVPGCWNTRISPRIMAITAIQPSCDT